MVGEEPHPNHQSAMPESPEDYRSKTVQLNIRITEEQSEGLERITANTSWSKTDLITAAIDAVVHCYEQEGWLPNPMHITPPPRKALVS